MGWLDKFKPKPASNPKDLPHIIVDDAHFCYEREDGTESQHYTIPATDEFVLRVGDYKFEIPADWSWTKPTHLQIMSQSQAGTLMFPLHGEDNFVIVAPKPFKSGEQIMLTIGRKFEGQFQSCWMSLATIE